MTPTERRSSMSLASLFALRMLGLFLILPVFAVHARGLPGGHDAMMVGLALGIYGLTQGVLQIPFGMASDRWGRKPVIVFGLLLLAVGSFIAATADDVMTTVLGRALQGAGAISAAVTAFIADSTRDSQRTKAMAMVGGSIAATFALSLVAAPLMYDTVGMGGIFALTGALSIAGIAVTLFAVPPAVSQPLPPERTPFSRIVADLDLLRLNFGIFTLHVAQMAMFVVLPVALVERLGVPVVDHWKIYLPVVLVSFALMMPPLNWADRHGRMRTLFAAAIGLLLLVMVGYAFRPDGLVLFVVLLLGFFTGFNVLEASVPALVSRLAPPDAKGSALGVYNTTQSLGLFFGGVIGGWLANRGGETTVFVVCGAMMAVWLVVALGARRWR